MGMLNTGAMFMVLTVKSAFKKSSYFIVCYMITCNLRV